MLRFLIFLFPALVDVVVGSLIFITTYRLVLIEASAFEVALPPTMWALGHSTFSFFVGMINTDKRAPKLIISACMVMALGSILMIVFPAEKLQWIWALLIGLGSALFFPSFQVFMKASDKDVHAGLVRSTAIYGFAWSTGIASGPFIASFVWGIISPDNGWIYCYIINILFVLAVAASTIPLRNYIKKYHESSPAPDVPSEEERKVNYSKMPNMVWLGWSVAAIGCLTITFIRTLFPNKANMLNISKEDLGFIMALLAYSQAFFSLLLVKSRYWMYKKLPMFLFALCGLTAMLLFGFGNQIWMFYLAAAVFGIYASSFFFCLVFHSLVHPEHSGKYVSWNEVVVGLMGILAPMAGGLLIDASKNVSLPFIIGGVIIAVMIIVQTYGLRKVSQNL